MKIQFVDTEWVAGLVDAEGYINRMDRRAKGKGFSHYIQIDMTDEDVIAHLVESGWSRSYRNIGARQAHHQEQYRTLIYGKPKTLALAPYLSERRRNRIEELIGILPPQGERSLDYYLGVLEGEGSFTTKSFKGKYGHTYNYARVSAVSTDADVIAGLHNFFDVGNVYSRRDPRNHDYKERFEWYVQKQDDVARVLSMCDGRMGSRRNTAIANLLDSMQLRRLGVAI